ncbi:hypothetical protein [Marinococcus halophilus]|nr:hypothetical protein [Marinococcus halophilus]
MSNKDSKKANKELAFFVLKQLLLLLSTKKPALLPAAMKQCIHIPLR